MKVGDKVKVVGTHSIAIHFFGETGEIVGFLAEKAVVMFEPRVGKWGSLSHTAYPDDLEILSE